MNLIKIALGRTFFLIMAVGVAMANAILLVTFVEQHRRKDASARDAGILGGSEHLRAILMTNQQLASAHGSLS